MSSRTFLAFGTTLDSRRSKDISIELVSGNLLHKEHAGERNGDAVTTTTYEGEIGMEKGLLEKPRTENPRFFFPVQEKPEKWTHKMATDAKREEKRRKERLDIKGYNILLLPLFLRCLKGELGYGRTTLRFH